MFRIVFLSTVLSLVAAQGTLNINFSLLFTTKAPVVYTPAPTTASPAPVPTTVSAAPVPTTISAEIPIECKTEDDLDGFCVDPNDCPQTKGEEGFIAGKKRVIDNSCSPKICCPFEATTTDPITTVTSATDNTKATSTILSLYMNQPAKQGCGWRYEDGIGIRSVGGFEANFGEFPYVLPIFKIEKGVEKYVSGGSLIHPRLVLTYAARYRRGGNFIVKAGEYDLLSNEERLAHQTIAVQKIVTHKKFNSGGMFNNIAILVLSEEVKPARHIGYACLPNESTRPSPGTACFAIGWGADTEVNGTLQSTPKMIKLPVLSRDDCENAIRPYTRPDFKLHPSVMCAGGVKDEDVCQGDGGSPLVCPYPGQEHRYYQAGIVSWGLSCGKESVPSMYSDVATLRSWIDSTIAAEGYNSTYFTP